MGFKSLNPLKRAIGPLDLDCPFIAISEYYVKDWFFRNHGHLRRSRGRLRCLIRRSPADGGEVRQAAETAGGLERPS